jgi:hypothetical protein
MLSFDQTHRIRSERREEICTWVQEILCLTEQDRVVVTQLTCTEPNCPPLETVIAVFSEGNPSRQWKVHKPADDLLHEEVDSLLRLGTGWSPRSWKCPD